VPIYSLHRARSHQAACMPYLGATTLAHVVHDLSAQPEMPASGRCLINTLQARQSTVRSGAKPSSALPASDSIKGEREEPSGAASRPQRPAQGDPVGSTVILEKSGGYSYVDAILWMTSRLADGLAHAHERGILHRDLKPANILLTDEGQPMLLDFNLAEDTKVRGNANAAALCGTLPYMSPEQMRSFRGDRESLDARTDLYSLGVVLFELLTGALPFPLRRRKEGDLLEKMLADRAGPPPRLRPRNRAVTPAVDAIV